MTLELYAEDIDKFIRFLGTKRSQMIKEITDDMAASAAELKFERAARLRDQIRAIEKLDHRADPQRQLAARDRERHHRAREVPRLAPEDPGPRLPHPPAWRPSTSPTSRATRPSAAKSASSTAAPSRANTAACITTVDSSNDYASIREVVSRRYREAGSGDELYPDVILIDGGLGQLHAALEAFESLDVRPPDSNT